MPSWFFSLQFRLVAGFALALALVLGGVSLYIGRAADREAERLENLSDTARALRIKQALADYYERNKDWKDVQPVLDRASYVSGREIVVQRKDGALIGDTRRDRGAHFDKSKQFKSFDLGSDSEVKVYVGPLNRVVWVVSPPDPPDPPKLPDLPTPPSLSGLPSYPGSPTPPASTVRIAVTTGGEAPHLDAGEFEEPSWARFAEVTNRSLLWAGVVAGAGGLLLVSLTSRRALRSVRALTTAARRMGAGDLSQRVDAGGRDEIGELSRTFNSMADALERAERQRRHLVADVAHELRTPLSNVQGYVEALRDGVLEPDDQTLATIHQQVLYLSELVEDLRLLADTEAGDFALHLESGSLAAALRESVEGVRARADAKGVAIATLLPASAPDLSFDRTRIAQVVGNLLDNAIRHTPHGGSVSVTLEFRADAATVSIADTGEGIPEEQLPFVFDRFYRVDPSRSRITGGAGLGLTIARQLVQAHGGTIRAQSAVGVGTTVVFQLPPSAVPSPLMGEG